MNSTIGADELATLHNNYTTSQQPPTPASSGSSPGLISRIASGLVQAPKYFLNTAIVNPIKEEAARATGNQQAYTNAVRQSDINLGLGANGRGIKSGVKTLVGNTAQLAGTLLAPEAKGAGVMSKVAAGAKAGAVIGGGSAMANNEDIVKGALGGAALGGALPAAGGILGKVIGKPITNAASKVANNQEVQQALEHITPFKGVHPKVLAENDLGGSMNLLKSLGMQPTPEAMHGAANTVTGDNGVVSGTMRQILAKAPAVETGDVLAAAKDALVKEGGQLGELSTKGTTPANNILASIRNELQSTLYKGEGSLSTKADANAVFDAVQRLEGRIRTLGTQGVDGAERRVLQATKQSLEDSLYNNGGIDQAVKDYKLAPEDIQAIHDHVAQQGGNAALGNHIVNGINDASSGKELRALQRPFVQMSHLATEADKQAAGKGVITSAEQAAKGASGHGYNPATRDIYYSLSNPAMLPFLAGDVARSGILNKVLAKGAPAVNAAEEAASKLPSSTRTGAVLASAAGQPSGQADTTTPEPALTAAAMPGTTASSEQPASASPYGQENMLYDVQRDPQNASMYMSLFKLLNPTTGNATNQKNETAAKNAESSLQQIESLFNAAGGGKGKVGGTIANFEGLLGMNSNVATYNSMGTALAASIYKELGNTGAISDQDQKIIKQLIPRTTDTPDSARMKIQSLSKLLADAEANAKSTSSSANSPDVSSPVPAMAGA